MFLLLIAPLLPLSPPLLPHLTSLSSPIYSPPLTPCPLLPPLLPPYPFLIPQDRNRPHGVWNDGWSTSENRLTGVLLSQSSLDPLSDPSSLAQPSVTSTLSGHLAPVLMPIEREYSSGEDYHFIPTKGHPLTLALLYIYPSPVDFFHVFFLLLSRFSPPFFLPLTSPLNPFPTPSISFPSIIHRTPPSPRLFIHF